jgi:mxaD protein
MVRRLLPVLSFVAVLAACGGEAPSRSAAPTLKVTKSVEINAPADQVWRKINDFNALHRWLPTIAKTEITRGQNNKPGAVRLLTLKAGGTVEQLLLAYNPAGMSYTYRIIRGVLPVSNYKSTITVESTGRNKSKVTWSSKFQRKDRMGKPAPGAGDKAAIDAVKSPYQAGLNNLKKIAERAS